jgi:regulator of sigma E protease
MLDLVLAILALGFLIMFHEGGHMLVARLCGMRVERFSIGFGKAIASWKRGDTTYQIAMIPFGGFVQIAGMNPLEPVKADDPGSYANKSVLKRMATIFAGPAANYLLAIVIFFVLAVGPGIGRPYANVVMPGSPGDQAGLLTNDEILQVNGTPVHTSDDVVSLIQAAKGAPVTLTVRRTEPFWAPVFRAANKPQPDWPDLILTDVTTDEKVVVTPRRSVVTWWQAQLVSMVPTPMDAPPNPDVWKWIHPQSGQSVNGQTLWPLPTTVVSQPDADGLLGLIGKYQTQNGPYRVGIGLGTADWDRERMPFAIAASGAIKMPLAVSGMILGSLADLVTGNASSKDVSGPVGITRVIKQQFDLGWGAALATLALLNVYLGLFNLLPWPALDGGRLVFLVYEATTRRRANAKVEQAVHAVGFALLLAVLLLVTAKDLIHLRG